MDVARVDAYRDRVKAVQDDLLEHKEALVGKDTEKLCPVKHSFGEGCYIREWVTPAGILTISRIHKVAHPFFVIEGDISVMTEDGVERIKAPYYGITQPGTKRILYSHETTRCVTVHVTDLKDPDEIVDEVTAKDFNDPQITEFDQARLKELIK
jgi:hypothetical protein